MEDVDAVFLEAFGRDGERVFAFLDQSALDAVGRVCELDAGVTDGRSTELVQFARVLASLGVHHDLVAKQQAVVSVLVSDDFDRGVDLVVALDQAADRGR